MANTNRTNPAYAYLAYRRAIINHVTHLLMTDYVAPTDGEPNEYILSDDVFKTDSQVPISEIKQYLEELQVEDAALQLEMNKFEFRAAEPPKSAAAQESAKGQQDDSGTESKDSQGSGLAPTPSASRRRGRGSKGQSN